MYICTYIILGNFHQHSYGFKNLMSSWGWGNTIFEITLCTWVFKCLVPNVFAYLVAFWKFLNFLENFKNLICRSKFNLKVRFAYCNFENYTGFRHCARNHQLVKERCAYIFPSGSSGSASTQWALKRRVLVDGSVSRWVVLESSRFSLFSNMITTMT